MKSEERHKLQQNELADYLAKVVEKIKPYQNAILGGIILVLVLSFCRCIGGIANPRRRWKTPTPSFTRR